ncbi:MAG: hypothetical protein COB98_08415 [Flavobacteriaceae bacterium]|nr:MAG: hypothetical protein COB98_08415 [Flavobacteriaceae bacterium]
MTTKGKLYIVLALFIFIGVIYIDATKKTVVNWFPSYVNHHKIPYGLYVLDHQLPKMFPETEIQQLSIAPYLYLGEEDRNGTYLFINDKIHFGNAELGALMEFVKRGNKVFMSSHGIMLDTLGFKTKALITTNYEESVFIKLLNKTFKGKEYTFDRAFSNHVFSEIDTLNTVVLGNTGYYNADDERTDEGANFVKFNYGEGQFFLHTFPEAFSNYALLSGELSNYAAGVLSYIEEDKLLLVDNYYKTGKQKITSPLKFILGNKHLKWAYYTLLIGVLLFIVFEGKRKQRSIKVLHSLKNQTLAFTRTIANMYFEKSEHKHIASHKITYFLAGIRSRFHLNTAVIDQRFYNTLALKSGNTTENVTALFKYFDFIQLQNELSTEQLITLNKKIEQFNKQIQ